MFTTREQQEIEGANASKQTPVVFIHGLWLLAESWNPWREFFEEQGFATIAPGWPDDPETVEEAKSNPDLFAGKSIGDITTHLQEVLAALDTKPILIGHSFGGMFAQKLAGRGLATLSVAIDPAPFRGVLPLPISVIRSSFPVLGNPANRNKAVPLTYDQFRYAFANETSEDEAQKLYVDHMVPGSGRPLFQAALSNLHPGTEASVDTHNPHRGPLLIISGEKDHIVPPAVSKASFKRYAKNPSETEIAEMDGRGHSLVIDSGWREVADTALAFIRKYHS